LLISFLKGSIIFTADLARALCDAGIATEIEFMKLSSYDGTKSTGKVSFSNGPIDAVLEKCVNRIVEDFLDTGRTLKLLIDMISDRRKAKGNAKKETPA
jgi:hypoxanthine phosphoribosyltransferase